LAAAVCEAVGRDGAAEVALGPAMIAARQREIEDVLCHGSGPAADLAVRASCLKTVKRPLWSSVLTLPYPMRILRRGLLASGL
jgi:hypothetical protein